MLHYYSSVDVVTHFVNNGDRTSNVVSRGASEARHAFSALLHALGVACKERRISPRHYCLSRRRDCDECKKDNNFDSA